MYTATLSLRRGDPRPIRCPPAANLAGQDLRSYGTHFAAGISLLISAFHAANITANIKPYAPRDAPLWFVVAAFGLFLAVCYLFVRHLEKNRIFLRL